MKQPDENDRKGVGRHEEEAENTNISEELEILRALKAGQEASRLRGGQAGRYARFFVGGALAEAGRRAIQYGVHTFLHH